MRKPTDNPPRDRAEQILRERMLARGDLVAEFYDRADGVECVKITRPRDLTFSLERPATAEDRERFEPEYRAFMEGR